MRNGYDGITHDYTRKQGCLFSEVRLPDVAPRAWQDRETLWNAVEAVEKAKDSRLARELIVALPIELGLDDWKRVLSSFVQQQCVNAGMCADYSIHDTDGHNPHAHILLTVRPLAANGKWQAKTQKEYLCRKSGEERGFTADEFGIARRDGWEKQYPCKVDKEKRMLTPSEMEALPDCVRTDKSPKATRYGRQNPIAERWNSEAQLLVWRQSWQDALNEVLEQNGHKERVDCRSHTARGMDEQPTLHEGYRARKIEQRGGIADRCEINRLVKQDNRLLRELKDALRKLDAAVKESLLKVAHGLERLRGCLVIWQYQLLGNYLRQGIWRKHRASLTRVLAEMKGLNEAIKGKNKERKALWAERKACKPFQRMRMLELDGLLAMLVEEMEELRSRKAMLNAQFDASPQEIKVSRHEADTQLTLLQQQEAELLTRKQEALAQYVQMNEALSESERLIVSRERERVRPEERKRMHRQLQRLDGVHYDYGLCLEAERAICAELNEPYQAPKKVSMREVMEASPKVQDKPKQVGRLRTKESERE